MRCVVCSATVQDNKCPICQFPVIAFPGDPEEGMRAIKPQIDAFRAAFLEKLDLGIIEYHWKDNNGVICLDREERLSFGSGTALSKAPVWLAQPFARLPDQQSVEVRLSVHIGDRALEKTVRLPNLPEPELQQIGAELDEHVQARLLLRNRSGATESGWTPLFE